MNKMEKIVKEKIIKKLGEDYKIDSVRFIDSYNFSIIMNGEEHIFTFNDETGHLEMLSGSRKEWYFDGPNQPLLVKVQKALEEASTDPELKIAAISMLVGPLTMTLSRSDKYKVSDGLKIAITAIKSLEDNNPLAFKHTPLINDYLHHTIEDKKLYAIIQGIFNILK